MAFWGVYFQLWIKTFESVAAAGLCGQDTQQCSCAYCFGFFLTRSTSQNIFFLYFFP